MTRVVERASTTVCSEVPMVVIASDYRNVDAALHYEEQLHGLRCDTEWVVEPETLHHWAELAEKEGETETAAHPYNYPPYRQAMIETFQDPGFHQSRLAMIREAAVVLGVNSYSSDSTKNILDDFVLDNLIAGTVFGKIAVVSEVFPSTVFRGGSYSQTAHIERGLQLNGQGIRRARGDMGRVRELYEESLESIAAEAIK